jgi:hypothetical protein
MEANYSKTRGPPERLESLEVDEVLKTTTGSNRRHWRGRLSAEKNDDENDAVMNLRREVKPLPCCRCSGPTSEASSSPLSSSPRRAREKELQLQA